MQQLAGAEIKCVGFRIIGFLLDDRLVAGAELDLKRLCDRFRNFILDCENPGRPVYRLAGTALCERFGFELKGTGFEISSLIAKISTSWRS